MSLLTTLSAEAATHVELPFPAVVFGIIGIVTFAALGLVMWSYRDVANRHPQKSAQHDASHGHADAAGSSH